MNKFINFLAKLSAILFVFFGLSCLYLFFSHNPEYSSIWAVLYGMACIYIALSVFIKKMSKTPALIILIWIVLDQIKLVINGTLHGFLTILIALPIIFLYFKKQDRVTD